MRQTTQYMLLWLEGPLQSWGGDSKFGVRDTLNFPTRSGILGLICCARGAAGPEVEWLAEMNNLPMEFAPTPEPTRRASRSCASRHCAISRWLAADMTTAIRGKVC